MSNHRNAAAFQTEVLVFLLSVGAIYAASFFPSARLWGINWYRYFGWYGPALLLLGSLLAVIAVRLRPVRWTGDRAASGSGDLRYAAQLTAALALAGPAFWLLRSRTHFLGDGYQITSKLVSGPTLVKPWDMATYSLQRAVYFAVGLDGNEGALVALQLVSIACGLFFVVMTGAAALYLYSTARDRWIFTLGVTTGGYMLLFFGYVENYPPLVLIVLAFVLCGVMTFQGIIPRVGLLLPLAAALILHPFGIALVPAAGYLWLHDSNCGARFLRAPMLARYAVIVFGGLTVVLGFYFLYTNNYFFRFSFVPMVPDRFTVEGYWLFSGKHLLDFLNLLALLLPGLPVLIYALWKSGFRRLIREPEYRFLGLLASAALVVAFLVNPRLGMPRDWDLLSFAGVPLAVLAFRAVLDSPTPAAGMARVSGFLAVALAVSILAPRVATQALPAAGIAHFDYLAELDVTRCRNGRYLLQQYLARTGQLEEKKRRALENSAALTHETWMKQATAMAEAGDYPAAIDKLQQSLRRDPEYPYAWGRLGVVYMRMARYDSALTCFRIADGLSPLSFTTYMQTAAAYHALKQPVEAERYWRKALRIDPDDLEALTYVAGSYAGRGMQSERELLVAELAGRLKVPAEAVSRLLDFEWRGDPDQTHVSRGLEASRQDLDSALVMEFEQLHPDFK